MDSKMKWNMRVFENKLTKLSFKRNEKKDFIEYWINEYDKDKYYFVSFKYTKDMDKIVTLNFSKKPQTINRVLLESYIIDNIQWKESFLYKNNKNKFDNFLLPKFERNPEFDIFEWWWILMRENDFIIK